MKTLFIKSLATILLLIFIGFNSICRAKNPMVIPPTTIENTVFAKGADISWLPQMEATGYIFYNDKGAKEDCFKILKDHGINSIRLRTWVNPSADKASGHCSKAETVAMGPFVLKNLECV